MGLCNCVSPYEFLQCGIFVRTDSFMLVIQTANCLLDKLLFRKAECSTIKIPLLTTKKQKRQYYYSQYVSISHILANCYSCAVKELVHLQCVQVFWIINFWNLKYTPFLMCKYFLSSEQENTMKHIWIWRKNREWH